MTVWALFGEADVASDFERSVVACVIEPSRRGYRLLLQRDGDIQLREIHKRIEAAREKADLLKEELLEQGWREDHRLVP